MSTLTWNAVRYVCESHGDDPTAYRTHGYICRQCAGCYGYHRTRYVQGMHPHDFEPGEYRQLMPIELGGFDDETGSPFYR